ncbi:DUF892 family protein [Kineococcus sp. SYSU DK004]|uniref:DUF892 family protein n=1 Tax=Kineococcus sp. SYSU DK004 TaxID=3383125 RepID=UPI003D7E1FE7
MFERLNTPEKIFSYKLGAALTMERDVLAMLGRLEEAAQRPELKQLLRERAAETSVQVEALEQCFSLLGEEVDDSPCPVTKALAAEAEATLKKTDDSLADAVVLAAALETSYHEQAVYETLAVHARARGAREVATLLGSSLAQQQTAGSKVKALAERIAMSGVATEVEGGRSAGVTAGIAAGVAATVGVAAAAASKVADEKAKGEAREAAEESLRTETTTTTVTPPATAPATAPVTDPGATGATGATGAEKFDDSALQERIAESEGRGGSQH